MKKWFYLCSGMFFAVIVTLSVHISFPTTHLLAAEVAFRTFIPAFITLLVALVWDRAKKKKAQALTISIIVLVGYLILNILGSFVPIAIPAITAVSLGIVACAFLTASELKLSHFGMLSVFVCQALAMVMFLVH